VRAVIRASDPGLLLAASVDRDPLPPGLLNVVAAGKAARPMLDALLQKSGDRVRDVAVGSGGHPVPDEASVEAGRRALAVAAGARSRGEWLVVLLSGGASAMLEVPAAGVTLADLAATTQLLLTSGLPIAQMNAVRKHLSAIKGGQLGAVAGRTVTYALSDVHAPVEDDPSVIGSGPTVADASTYRGALDALDRAGVAERLPPQVREWLSAGASGAHPETPKPGDARLSESRFHIAGNRQTVVTAAAAEARARGYGVTTIERAIVGETRDAAKGFIDAAPRGDRPAALIGAGETTVTLPPQGPVRPGGRNQEFTLAAARRLADLAPAVFVSAGTDGIDGGTDAAGAFADDTTLRRAAAAGFDIDRVLREHASHDFFARLDDLLVTGPTGTNLGDLQVLLLGTTAGAVRSLGA
jgi:hydroxypyruvate reductase